jgi:hypothetical protein
MYIRTVSIYRTCRTLATKSHLQKYTRKTINKQNIPKFNKSTIINKKNIFRNIYILTKNRRQHGRIHNSFGPITTETPTIKLPDILQDGHGAQTNPDFHSVGKKRPGHLMFKKCAKHRGHSTYRLHETGIHFNVQFFADLPLI